MSFPVRAHVQKKKKKLLTQTNRFPEPELSATSWMFPQQAGKRGR